MSDELLLEVQLSWGVVKDFIQQDDVDPETEAAARQWFCEVGDDLFLASLLMEV